MTDRPAASSPSPARDPVHADRGREEPSSEHGTRRALRGAAIAAAAAAAILTFIYVFGGKVRVPNSTAEGLKGGIAVAAFVLSAYETQRYLGGRPFPERWVKLVAGVLAVAAVAGYFNFGDIGYARFYHRWEFFHYYLGSKYDRELGYTRLYRCAAVAQSELGPAMEREVRLRKVRNLETDILEPAAPVLEHPEECKDRFGADRWKDFKADVAWFRGASNLKYWNDQQTDHGYNPPPVWTIGGHALASLAPASDEFLKVLAAIDPILFAATFWAIWWAFGWRVLCVALVFWGTQLPANYFWTGGAFLRQDWLFLLVLSGCLLRKRYFAWAGAAFAYSTLLRVFPGLLAAGWAVVMVTHLIKRRRLAPEHVRLLGGGLVATAILVGASVAVTGKQSYGEFFKHIQVHNDTPLTNHMGLPTILSHSPEGRMQRTRDERQMDPFLKWKEARRAHFRDARVLYVMLLGVIAAGFIYVVRRVRSLWIAQAVSLVVVLALTQLTCYYYSMFLLATFLSRVRRWFEHACLFVAAASAMLVRIPAVSYYWDDRFTAQSILFFGFSVALVLGLWPGSTPRVAQQRPALVEAEGPVSAPPTAV